MCHRYRSALFDLALEYGNNRTVRAKNVAESNGHKLGFDIFEDLPVTGFIRVFSSAMHIKLRDLICFSCLDLGVEALDDHFAQTLARAHDICRIDSLVCTDEHKPLAAVHHSGIGRFICTDRIVFDCLARAVLHQRDMLVRRGMIYDVRPVIMKDLVHFAAVANRTDQNDEIQLGIFILQFKLDVIGVILIYIENDQLLRAVSGYLTAKLRADASAAACDHNGLSVDKAENLFEIWADRVSPKQVLDRNVFQRFDSDLAGK